MGCVPESPCCQFKATSSAFALGTRKRTSKYVALVRLLPEKVAVTEPPRRALGLSNTTLLLTGITSVSDFKSAHGPFLDVIQLLFSKMVARVADRLRITKPKGAFAGTLFDTRMGGFP